MKLLKVALIGISGFGAVHLRCINELWGKSLDLKAIVAVNYEKNKEVIDNLTSKGVRYYKDYKQMLIEEKDLDFVAISTPIHMHAPMAIEAMQIGHNILLEKPPCVTVQDINAIIETSVKTKKICAVNFQNTSGKAFRKLLEYVKEGSLGEIYRITGVGRWKRNDDYYKRNAWAGKLIVDGHYVLDGTINNPLAHLLNNELIIAETSEKDGGVPQEVTAELYHGHNIEGEDTTCVRIKTKTDIDVYYYTTLCNTVEEQPYIEIESEKAKVFWSFANKLKIEYKDGSIVEFDGGREDLFLNMYVNMVEHINEGKELFCPIQITKNFILASNGAFESGERPISISDEYLTISEENGKIYTYINNIKEIIDNCSKEGKLFSEMNIPWAKKSKPFYMDGYKEFKLYK